MHNHVLDYLYRIEDKKPDKTAYTDGTAGLTFKEVANVTRSVGSFLAGKGIYRKPVVVFMQKSAMEIASFFGVIAGGCYYVPLDEEMDSVVPEGQGLEESQENVTTADEYSEESEEG